MVDRITTLKQQGTDAFNAKNCTEAISRWSDAIRLTKGEAEHKEIEKSLYGNRCYAYLHTGIASDLNCALLDAEKCISLDSSWPKAYLRKAQASYRLARFADSVNAFNKAFELDSSLKMKYEQEYNKSKSALNNQSQRGYSASGAGANPNGSRTAAIGGFWYGILSKSQLACRFAIFYFGMVVMLPGWGFIAHLKPHSYFRLGAAAATSYILALLLTHGVPHFTTIYAQKIMMDPSFMYLFMSLLVVGTAHRPYIMAIQPFFLTETAWFFYSLNSIFPALCNAVSALVNNAAARIPSFQGYLTLDANGRWKRFFDVSSEIAAKTEVYMGIYLIIELFLPTRNLLLLFLWWQYLQLRYMTDSQGHVKAGIHEIDSRILSVVGHQYCPSLLNTGYMFIRTYLAKKSDPAQVQRDREAANANSAAGGVPAWLSGAASKCTVM